MVSKSNVYITLSSREFQTLILLGKNETRSGYVTQQNMCHALSIFNVNNLTADGLVWHNNPYTLADVTNYIHRYHKSS